MVDLHCHILPGLDDGARDLQEALEMARIAVQDGITDLVATPHAHNGVYDNPGERVLAVVERFQAALREANIPLRVHPGAEAHVHWEMLKNIRMGNVLTVGNRGKYVLVELPVLSVPRYTEELLYQLRVAGVTPVLAHPERNSVIRKQPELLAEWIKKGALAQLTAGSLTGQMGKKTRAFALYLVQKSLVHVIASDAHNTRTRKPLLREAYQVLGDLTGGQAVPVFQANAAAILQGRACEVREPFAEYKKKRFRLF